jgi:hypothetical protein
MKQMKVALSDELRARLDAASAKSGQSVAEEIRSRVETSFRQEAILDKPTHDFFVGVALMPAEIERETGAAWHKHPGAHEVFKQAFLLRLEELKPKGSTAFGDRPHATTSDDDPRKLGLMIEYRLRRQPDFTNSPTRQLMEDEHQRVRLNKVLVKEAARRRRQGLDVSLLNEPFDQPKKRGK